MKRIFIIHGWDSTPQEGWFPWLKKQLEQKGFEAVVLAMPQTNEPMLATWVSHLFQIIINPDKETYLVGHDIGATTVLRYLEKLPQDEKIGGAVLIAPLIETVGLKETENFFEEKISYSKIKLHTKKFTAIYSDDDPLVPLKQSEVLKDELGAAIITQEGMKHFSGADGIIELPIALNSILETVK